MNVAHYSPHVCQRHGFKPRWEAVIPVLVLQRPILQLRLTRNEPFPGWRSVENACDSPCEHGENGSFRQSLNIRDGFGILLLIIAVPRSVYGHLGSMWGSLSNYVVATRPGSPLPSLSFSSPWSHSFHRRCFFPPRVPRRPVVETWAGLRRRRRRTRRVGINNLATASAASSASSASSAAAVAAAAAAAPLRRQ